MSTTSSYRFSAGDICKIIKQCGESNVKKLKVDDMEIDFVLGSDPAIQYVPYIDNNAKMEHNQDINPFLKQDEMNQKDRELEELKLTDPFQYESLLVQRELGEEDA